MSAQLRSGRVESARPSHLISAAYRDESGDDSYGEKLWSDQAEVSGGRRRAYVTARRLSLIEGALNAQQRATMGLVARLHVVSGRQVQELFYAPTEAGRRLARRDLAELTDLLVLSRLERRIGGVRAGSAGYIYALGIAGQRLSQPEKLRHRQPWTPGISFLRHALAVSDLYVRLQLGTRSSVATLTTFDAEPGCWRRFARPGGARLSLKPDAYVVMDDAEYEQAVFIEIDRATEPLTRIRTKCQTYVRYYHSGREQAERGLFPQVVWAAARRSRVAQLEQVIRSLPADERALFAVTTTAGVPTLLGIANGGGQP